MVKRDDHNEKGAMKRLHEAVIELDTVDECAKRWQEALNKFDVVITWHGTDHKYLKHLGTSAEILDLGQVFEELMAPVRAHFKSTGEQIKLSQEVASILLSGKWLPPHLSENDALMLRNCFLVLSKLQADAAALSDLELSQITSFSQLL